MNKLLYNVLTILLNHSIPIMKIHQGNYFTVSIPDSWDAEYDVEEGIDVLFGDNAHGEVQISSVIHDEDLTPNDLMHIAEEDLQAGATPQEIDLDDFHGFWFDYSTKEEYWCEWYLCCGQLMLFVTYNCPVEDEGKDFDEVEKMIGSLLPSNESHGL